MQGLHDRTLCICVMFNLIGWILKIWGRKMPEHYDEDFASNVFIG